MSSSATEMQFDDLADRLRRLSVSEKHSEAEINMVMNMTLEELQQEKITFGKAHVGKTFAEMALETRYLTWFTETFRHSRRIEHVKLLRFVQLHLEQIETAQRAPYPTTVRPKAKAKMPPTAPSQPIDLELEEEGDSWDPIHEEGEMVNLRLQDRMNQMEVVMQEVLGHLRRTAGENLN